MAGDKNGFIYMKLYNDLRGKIERDEIKAGDKLPPENILKDEYGVSRDSMRRALAKLESEGYISRKAAAGTFVLGAKADYSLLNHESFSEQMRKIGLTPSSEIVSIELQSEPEKNLIDLMRLSEGDRLYKISRVRKADGEPMAYEMTYIPQKLCPNLHTLIYDDTSMYELYENHYGIVMRDIELSIGTEMADSFLQKVLKLKSSSPVLKMTGIMRLDDGNPLYYVIGYYHGDKYIFSTKLPRKRK